MIGCTQFSRRNFRLHLLLQNIYKIYAKFYTHLRCFSSRFTLESAQARTRARSVARDFHAVILGPVCCYKTEIGFTLNFELIYNIPLCMVYASLSIYMHSYIALRAYRPGFLAVDCMAARVLG
jgi:hypothetical protein